MEDWKLAELLRDRDPAGADYLLRHYGPLMRYIVAPILSDEREREECLSDIALTVWEKIGTFDSARGSFTTWLTALTRNAALNRARSGKSAQRETELSPDLPAPDGDPEEALLRRERQEALGRALKSLSPADRALFYRKYYYMQSTAQIAAELGSTARAVEGRLYRVKQKLRTKMGGDGYGKA